MVWSMDIDAQLYRAIGDSVMWQSVAQVTAGCNEQNIVFNNGLLELQPAVMLQFCNITAGCYLNH